jgi:hypothetical protein
MRSSRWEGPELPSVASSVAVSARQLTGTIAAGDSAQPPGRSVPGPRLQWKVHAGLGARPAACRLWGEHALGTAELWPLGPLGPAASSNRPFRARKSTQDRRHVRRASATRLQLCHDNSGSETVPKNGQVQLWAHACAAFAS